MTWLIYIEALWELLSSEIHRERVSSIIWEVNLIDLDGIVSEEVVPHKLKVLRHSEES